MNEIVETWEIHNRINLYLLNSIEESHLSSISLTKGRTVAEHFAHLHNVRLMWLKSGMPELLDSVEKIDKENITKELLINQLHLSGNAVSKMIKKAMNDGKLKGFKPHPTAFLGYIISHESHHRGQIALCLKQSGHPIDKKIAFGLWEWGTK